MFLIEPELLRDECGCFARTFDTNDVCVIGLGGPFVQSSVSANQAAGTIRGLHHQVEPATSPRALGPAVLSRVAHRLWLADVTDASPRSALTIDTD